MDTSVPSERYTKKISKELILSAINHSIGKLSLAQTLAITLENMRERTPDHYALNEQDCVELIFHVEDELDLDIDLNDEYANFGVLYDATVASAGTRFVDA